MGEDKMHLEKGKEDQERKQQRIMFRMKQLAEEEKHIRCNYERMVETREQIRERFQATGEVRVYVAKLNLNQDNMESHTDKKMYSKSLMRALVSTRAKKKKMQQLVKTMDYIVRAKREEETHMIEEEFHKCLIEERVVHEYMQQKEVELSLLRHAGDLQVKYRLARMLDSKKIVENRIATKRAAEHDRLMMERAEILKAQKQERETERKMLYYLKSEEEKLQRFHEAGRLEEEDERKKVEKIVDMQRQRESEEKTGIDLGKRLPFLIADPSFDAAAPLTSPPLYGKYVPKHLQGLIAGSGSAPALAEENDRRTKDAPPPPQRWAKRFPPSTLIF